ncbi:hypothetical protein BXZ70DRAFT_1009303 [Cristinia sonorae]|uniref:Uncharacterized protein n=1 Tax=Cristinia sonorae TaxID=1940300 RepID=A0A8K0ULH3_9AGAR|nr:hypothetical protein BXZ70DRAFT_1009303 [Cristinia sonorae]
MSGSGTTNLSIPPGMMEPTSDNDEAEGARADDSQAEDQLGTDFVVGGDDDDDREDGSSQ